MIHAESCSVDLLVWFLRTQTHTQYMNESRSQWYESFIVKLQVRSVCPKETLHVYIVQV